MVGKVFNNFSKVFNIQYKSTLELVKLKYAFYTFILENK